MRKSMILDLRDPKIDQNSAPGGDWGSSRLQAHLFGQPGDFDFRTLGATWVILAAILDPVEFGRVPKISLFP